VSVFQVERRFHISAGVAAALAAGILAVPAAAGSASAAGTPPGTRASSPSRPYHPHHRVSSPSLTQGHPGYAAAMVEDQKVVDAMTPTIAAPATSILPEQHGFTAGSHDDVKKKLGSLAGNQILNVIAVKIRGGSFEEAELFAPDARIPGTGYVSAERTVSYDDLVKEGRYNLFYKVHTLNNSQSASAAPQDIGTSSSTTHQQHTPQPLSPTAQRILGKMKSDSIKAEVFTFLNIYPGQDFSVQEIFRGTTKAKNPASIHENLNIMIAEGTAKRTVQSKNTGSGGIPARYQALREDEYDSHHSA